MNNVSKIKLGFLLIGFMLSVQVYAQNLQTMYIEKMESVSLVVPEQCTPEDLVILINSSIPNLKFESNMLPVEDFIVTYSEASNQYIICHEKIKFKLTVSGPNLQSEDIEIFDMDKPIAYRISANTAKGKVNIVTNPRNSTVIFPELNNLVLSANQPITNVSGKYRVNIVKAQYKNVDTVIVIPRDAEKTYNIDLIPLFSRIKLDLRTDDNAPFIKPPVIWIDSVRIELEAIVKQGINQRSFFDDVEFLKFYEGNIIPVIEGTHKIKIEAESYIPYETTLQAKNGKLHSISVSFEPIFGYLTFVDKQFSEGASIFINDQNIGKVPLFKVKTRVGINKVRFEKPGFIPLEKEYTIAVQEKINTDFDVAMQVARKINFATDPSYAEVIMDGTRLGFTPFTTLVSAGNHEILIRKSGFASEKISKLINETTPDEETVNYKLRSVKPLTIRSEKDGLIIKLIGTGDLKNIEIDQTLKTPGDIPLPYGNYKISLLDDKKVLYKSTVNHSPEILKRGKIPNYSRSSFHVLTANYIDKNNFEASFGRIHIFPGSGLSTALINVDYKMFEDPIHFEIPSEKGNPVSKDSINVKILAPYIFFLNWDWRIGGSILRQLDINLLGRAKYTPGLKSLATFGIVNIPKYSDVEMTSFFYGFEVSSRLSYANISFRFGRQINNGKLNYYDKMAIKYTDIDIPIKEDQYVASIGITLNGKVYKANNMLRLWNKPLLDPARRKSTVISSTADTDKNFFGKTKFFGK